MGLSFNIRGETVTFAPAEVLEVLYTETTPIAVGMIKVSLLDTGVAAANPEADQIVTAIPLNRNIRRIPIVGEVVLLVKAPGPYVSGLRASYEHYYLDIVSLQSSIHHNGIPTSVNISSVTNGLSGNSANYNSAAAGASTTQSEPKIDADFPENENVKPLQPYVGDFILEGRHGNSIRFSSTQKPVKFSIDPNWNKANPGDPILTIRNTRQTQATGKINDYVTEDFTKDDNSIVLSTGQELTFEQSSKALSANKSVQINSWQKENWGKTPQMLLSSGRIIFNSSQKEIIAFAKNGIGLSSETNIGIDAKDTVAINGGQKILLGTNATEALVLGTSWQAWMNSLITALGSSTVITPMGPSSPLLASPTWASVAALQAQLPTLISDSVFTKKKTTP
jgi:hypothetical protein